MRSDGGRSFTGPNAIRLSCKRRFLVLLRVFLIVVQSRSHILHPPLLHVSGRVRWENPAVPKLVRTARPAPGGGSIARLIPPPATQHPTPKALCRDWLFDGHCQAHSGGTFPSKEIGLLRRTVTGSSHSAPGGRRCGEPAVAWNWLSITVGPDPIFASPAGTQIGPMLCATGTRPTPAQQHQTAHRRACRAISLSIGRLARDLPHRRSVTTGPRPAHRPPQ